METDHPIVGALVVTGLYLVFSASVWLVNETFMNLDFPWTWYWLIWAPSFSPAAGATILAAVTYMPDARRLRVLNAIALAGILAAMEVCALLDAALAPTILTMFGVSVAIVFAFRAATSRAK